ncbi:MAG: cysteine desulfurase [Planctomycetales bacterium]|nr:cysteine desulfurase [Planctomycetales bacterium]
MRSIYLDYCSTTPIAASVREAMLPFLHEFYGLPSNHHWFGRCAQEAIEDARASVASLLGCHPAEIIFTSGGTESVNLGILGVARAISGAHSETKPHLIISTLEHASVDGCANQLKREGWDVSQINCNALGIIDLDTLQSAIRKNTRIISITHASYRFGTVQPIAEIAAICQASDILLHTDAAQTVGKIDCNVERLGVDALSLSGHKFYAPKGIGALYLRMGVPIDSILFGEGNETGLRPGTENVSHIVGLGQAARLAKSGLETSSDRISEMRDYFHARLERLLGCEIPIHGLSGNRLPGVLSIELPGVEASGLQRQLPEICFGPTLPRQEVNNYNAQRNLAKIPSGILPSPSVHTLRISFGWQTSQEELDKALQLIVSAYDSLTER